MKTKNKIKAAAIGLFNENGFRNVTLRAVAEKLGISYGNVTYHYRTKDDLLLELYDNMSQEMGEILLGFKPEKLFLTILKAPKLTFNISKKYAFFYIDFVEIKRNYPEILSQMNSLNEQRQVAYLKLLQELQQQGIFRKDLSDDDLKYLMELSSAMRTFYFISLVPNNMEGEGLEGEYIRYVNRLVYPYLTAKGRKEYNAFVNA